MTLQFSMCFFRSGRTVVKDWFAMGCPMLCRTTVLKLSKALYLTVMRFVVYLNIRRFPEVGYSQIIQNTDHFSIQTHGDPILRQPHINVEFVYEYTL